MIDIAHKSPAAGAARADIAASSLTWRGSADPRPFSSPRCGGQSYRSRGSRSSADAGVDVPTAHQSAAQRHQGAVCAGSLPGKRAGRQSSRPSAALYLPTARASRAETAMARKLAGAAIACLGAFAGAPA